MSALDHRLLRQFLAVAECGTVRGAAERLAMSQPPLTAAIRSLEERLGVALFVRSAKGVRLTLAGEVLAADARAILGALRRAEARVRSGERAPLRIGFVSATLGDVLPRAVRRLALAGDPTPALAEMTTPEQHDALVEGRLDVGFLHPPVPPVGGLGVRSLGRDPHHVALPVSHPLAGQPSLRFAAIAGEPFVLFPEAQGPVLFARIRAEAERAGATLTVVAEATRIHTQLSLVAAGLGVGLVTAGIAGRLSVRGAVTVPLADTADTLFVELAAVGEPPALQRLFGPAEDESDPSASRTR